MFTGAAIYGVILLLGLAFLRGASKVSGNHQDPFRDVGNGGCTVEESFLQYARENPEVDIVELAKQYGVVLTQQPQPGNLFGYPDTAAARVAVGAYVRTERALAALRS